MARAPTRAGAQAPRGRAPRRAPAAATPTAVGEGTRAEEGKTSEYVPDTAAATPAPVEGEADRLGIHKHRIRVIQTYTLPAFGLLLAFIGLFSLVGLMPSLTAPAIVVIAAGLAIFAGQSITSVVRQFVGSGK